MGRLAQEAGAVSHTCHIPICKAYCPPKHLYCGTHWAMVPAEIQAEVYATVGKRKSNEVNASWAPWWRAVAKAEEAVMRPLCTNDAQHKWLTARIKRDVDFANDLERER